MASATDAATAASATAAETAHLTCGACLMPILAPDGTPRLNPAHSCKDCSHALHSYVLCDDVWMPEEDGGAYFCNLQCIRAYNRKLKQRHDAELKAVEGQPAEAQPVVPKLFALIQRPREPEPERENEIVSEESDSKIDVADEKCPSSPDMVDSEDDGDGNFSELPSVDVDVDEFDAEAAAAAAKAAAEEKTAAEENKDAEEKAIDELLVEGTRVCHGFRKETPSAEAGTLWWGGLMGSLSADGMHACVAYDDGVIMFYTTNELKDSITKGIFKASQESGGLIKNVPQAQYAESYSHIQLNKKSLPIGVLLKEGDQKLCCHTLYKSHVLSIEVASKLLDGTNHVVVRRGRSKTKDSSNDPRLGYHSFRRGDIVQWIGEGECDGDELVEQYRETVHSVMLFYQRSQQRRFLISFDESLSKFSINSWVSWARVLKDGVDRDVDVDIDENVLRASDEAVTRMCKAWEGSHLHAVKSLDQLQKQSLLGPARAVEKQIQLRLESERKRKREAATKKEKENEKKRKAIEEETKHAVEQVARKAAKEATDQKRKGKPDGDSSDWKSDWMRQRDELVQEFELSRQKMIKDHAHMLADVKAQLRAAEGQLRGGGSKEVRQEVQRASDVGPQIQLNSTAGRHIQVPRQLTNEDLLRIEVEEAAALAEEEKRARERIRQQLRGRDARLSDQGSSSSHILPEDDRGHRQRGTGSHSQRSPTQGHSMSAYLWREVEELELQIARIEAEQRVERLSYREGDLEVLRLRLRDRKRQLFS